MKCDECGCEFVAKTATQRFCDTYCRTKYHNEERRLNKLANDAIRAISKLRVSRSDARHIHLARVLLKEISESASK